MLPEPTDAVLRLKLVFVRLPIKGLLFWEALLFFKDDVYKEVVEDKFADVVESFSCDDQNKEARDYYQQILDDLREIRAKVSRDQKVRSEVIAIRDAIISRSAYETAIFDMYNANLKESNKE